MKINKIILYICHFFGLRLNEEHIDDITINIDSDCYTDLDMNFIQGFNSFYYLNSRTYNNDEFICNDIRNKAYAILKANPKIDKRCTNAKYVWLTFYKKNANKKEGSIARICQYIDGIIYLDISKVDNNKSKRHEKINNILS